MPHDNPIQWNCGTPYTYIIEAYHWDFNTAQLFWIHQIFSSINRMAAMFYWNSRIWAQKYGWLERFYIDLILRLGLVAPWSKS